MNAAETRNPIFRTLAGDALLISFSLLVSLINLEYALPGFAGGVVDLRWPLLAFIVSLIAFSVAGAPSLKMSRFQRWYFGLFSVCNLALLLRHFALQFSGGLLALVGIIVLLLMLGIYAGRKHYD